MRSNAVKDADGPHRVSVKAHGAGWFDSINVSRYRALMSRTYLPVARVADVPAGSIQCVEAAGRRLALIHHADGFYALDDECSHDEAWLCEGTLVGDAVQCPWHGARFDLRTGEALGPPAIDGVGRYNVRITGDQVEVEV